MCVRVHKGIGRCIVPRLRRRTNPLDRSADSLFLNLFDPARVGCNRRARSTPPLCVFLFRRIVRKVIGQPKEFIVMADKDLSPYQVQHDSIRKEFKKQADSWGKNEISSHLQWVVERLSLQSHFEVLDVAAGSALLSRAISPHVKQVVASDITPEMLAQGQSEANRQGMTNISFEQGAAEDLPYPNAKYDMVVTRFSVHHFKSPDVVIREMCRVCRHGGNVVVID